VNRAKEAEKAENGEKEGVRHRTTDTKGSRVGTIFKELTAVSLAVSLSVSFSVSGACVSDQLSPAPVAHLVRRSRSS